MAEWSTGWGELAKGYLAGKSAAIESERSAREGERLQMEKETHEEEMKKAPLEREAIQSNIESQKVQRNKSEYELQQMKDAEAMSKVMAPMKIGAEAGKHLYESVQKLGLKDDMIQLSDGSYQMSYRGIDQYLTYMNKHGDWQLKQGQLIKADSEQKYLEAKKAYEEAVAGRKKPEELQQLKSNMDSAQKLWDAANGYERWQNEQKYKTDLETKSRKEVAGYESGLAEGRQNRLLDKEAAIKREDATTSFHRDQLKAQDKFIYDQALYGTKAQGQKEVAIAKEEAKQKASGAMFGIDEKTGKGNNDKIDEVKATVAGASEQDKYNAAASYAFNSGIIEDAIKSEDNGKLAAVLANVTGWPISRAKKQADHLVKQMNKQIEAAKAYKEAESESLSPSELNLK